MALMVPYFCMNIFCLLFFLFVEYFQGELDFNVLKSHIWAILLGVGYNVNSIKPVCTAMWFFYALFIIKLLYNVFPKNRFSKVIQVAICFVIVKILGAPDKPCGVGRADANPKLLLNDT